MSQRNKPKKPERDSLRIRLWRRQNGNCYYCGKAMQNMKLQTPESATFEHLIPAVLGGAFSNGNIVLAHKECNEIRGRRHNERPQVTVGAVHE